MKYILATLFYFLIGLTCAFTQSGKDLFNDAVLHEIRISITLPNWFDTLQYNYDQHRLYPDSIEEISRSCSVIIDGIKMDSVGYREKGNFSNASATIRHKKPFKLEFDEWLNHKFDGLKSINLNNGADDPSFVREALCYKLMRDFGVYAPRVSFAKLYINNWYWGIYVLVEQVDKTFLKEKYGNANKDGNLYKTGKTASTTLQWLGSSADSVYEDDSGLEQKGGNATWARLIHFIDIINNLPQEKMRDSLSKIFDVSNYLRVLAVEKMVNSWDSYWGGGNNFYVYEHPDGIIRWIPWDMNETLPVLNGPDLSSIFQSSSYLVPTNKFEDRPLIRAILKDTLWKREYLDNICKLLNHPFTVANLDTTIYRWHSLIDKAVEQDTNKLYPYESFEGSLTANRVKSDFIFPKSGIRIARRHPGIFPFMNERRLWALEQMGFNEYTCNAPAQSTKEYGMSVYPNPSGTGNITLKWDATVADVSQLQLVDAFGRITHIVYQYLSSNKSLTFTPPDLPAGLYLIRKLDADGNRGVCRWIKGY